MSEVNSDAAVGQNSPAPAVGETENLNEILRVRREKLAQMQQSGQDPFLKVKFNKTHSSQNVINGFETLENQTVTLAGRIISRRIMGKASFCHILDEQGLIQIYLKSDELGELYNEFKAWDIGDIVGVSGTVFKTHAGEISVRVAQIEMLAKSLLPLPEKFHGLKDTDARYRQRYVDLIANPDVKKTFFLRSAIISEIRRFLDTRGFIEVETPILSTIASGATARPFVTHHNTLDLDMFLRIAPELYLKRLIVGGFEKVYEIGRMFRNEGMDVRHNPEFTMLELYQAYTDYEGVMQIVQDIFCHVADNVLGARLLPYGDDIIDLNNWTRLSMAEAVKIHCGVDFLPLNDAEAVAAAKKLGAPVIEKSKQTWGYALAEVFDQKVEEKLIQPTFICEYPVEISPLAKKKASDTRLTERFEFFICAREFGNAFSELNDPIDQNARINDQAKQRLAGDDEAQMADDDYVTALEYGLPPTGGLGIGIDRMVMLFTNSHSIRDVLLFPTMKPVNK